MKATAIKNIPEVNGEERAVDELVKSIRKLRWIGREDEARRLQHALLLVSPSERPSVLGDPLGTD